MLLERARVPVVAAIERLAALQAQSPRAPYVGLWSRLERFERHDLESALRSRRVVKATLMRGTLHLATAGDYPFYAVATPEARRALWASTQRQLLAFMARAVPDAKRYVAAGGAGIADAAKMHEAILRHTATPRSREDIVALMAKTAKMPVEVATRLVWSFIAAHGMVVHAPASGLFAADRSGDLLAARVALPEMKVPSLADAVTHTVRRYLAAFGPATVEDVTSWTSIRSRPVRAAIASFGAAVVTFRDERGRVLYDLAKAPRPPAETPAPLRFLPKWDSTLLAYTPSERLRILGEEHRAAVIIKNGDIAQTVLVDGMVAGTWTLARTRTEAVVQIAPLGKVARAQRSALVEEGERLAAFLDPEARTHGARV
jgi:hypothetical protein